jgi:hypothetical protein
MSQGHSAALAERPLSSGETDLYECWVRALNEHDVQYLVLNPHSKRDVVEFFRTHPVWEVDFEDEDMIIFVRDDRLNKQQIHDRLL